MHVSFPLNNFQTHLTSGSKFIFRQISLSIHLTENSKGASVCSYMLCIWKQWWEICEPHY